jgi:hypothetical protein
MAKKYIVALTVEEREKLLNMIGSGTAKARTLTHARILLKADEGWPDPQIRKPSMSAFRRLNGCANGLCLKDSKPF